MVFDSVLAAVGHTPIIRLALPGPATAYAKLELQNLFAMKDRVAREVITAALASGALRPGDPIIESSSGTMALGLALVRSWLVASDRRSTVHVWPALTLVLLLATSMTESYLLAEGGLMLFVLCAVTAARGRSWRGRLPRQVA